MGLRESCSPLSPLYEPLLASATRAIRRRSLAALGDLRDQLVLLPGIGTRLDTPHRPPGAVSASVEITSAMLERAA